MNRIIIDAILNITLINDYNNYCQNTEGGTWISSNPLKS